MDAITPTDFMDKRLHVKSLSSQDSTLIKLKYSNLLEPKLHSEGQSFCSLSDYEITTCLWKTLRTQKELMEPGIRRVMQRRYKYIRTNLHQGKVPAPTKCMSLFIDEKDKSVEEHLFTELQPTCTGDTVVDFHRFADGLTGNGDMCDVCFDELTVGCEIFAMPCRHFVHKRCGMAWFTIPGNERICPCCRQKTPVRYKSYLRYSHVFLQKRMDEWVVSGMCERCQQCYHEASPMVAITGPDGTAEMVSQAELEAYGMSV
ncbi:hypothetical protein SARC_06198 [Sphaeroforma arctica JP610]|uniref:RING-type domain-containing protein n=1 Tax=Sphaeroforma arctica JP610 TaxID=667725 RepID=A0A0L0FZS1_9EUKA|nr:hypothetical protein SARC_06198 [Sphaeroforma arctica JP610]KNC81468.1 hypothetical protein SARC_06198 [Sphaeroforma arctica JP610]|eukprot:XP_014155370.1 hypothetical protein SARC_06198 [Sphaeroforma arctica JP610]